MCRTTQILASLSSQTLFLPSWNDAPWAGVAMGCENKPARQRSLVLGVLNLQTREHRALPTALGRLTFVISVVGYDAGSLPLLQSFAQGRTKQSPDDVLFIVICTCC